MNSGSVEFEASPGRPEQPGHVTGVSVRSNEPGRTAVPAVFRVLCGIW